MVEAHASECVCVCWGGGRGGYASVCVCVCGGVWGGRDMPVFVCVWLGGGICQWVGWLVGWFVGHSELLSNLLALTLNSTHRPARPALPCPALPCSAPSYTVFSVDQQCCPVSQTRSVVMPLNENYPPDAPAAPLDAYSISQYGPVQLVSN